MHARSLSSVFALSCALAAAPHLAAQTLTTGVVDGTVRDVRDEPLPQASLLLREPATGFTRRITADALGEFRFDDLAPGEYLLQCSASGFSSASIASLLVQAGQTARVALSLRPSAIAQTVTVRATEAEQPSLTDSPLNGSLVPQELQALPIDGRRFQDFALLTPLVNLADDGVLLDPNSTSGNPLTDTTDDADNNPTGDTAQLTIRSLDPTQNSFSQDGATASRSYDGAPRGSAAVPFNVPLEAVREFQVRSLGDNSPLGRDAAGSVNAVLRRGEDRLHGSAFFFIRNSAADASDPFAIATRYNNGAPVSAYVKPNDQREQFGGSLGRLIPHTGHRLYAFGAAEAQRRSFPGISSPDNPAFFALTAMQRALLGNRGVSTAATQRALAFLDSLGGEFPRQSRTLAVTPRIDLQTSQTGSLLVSYTGVRHNSPVATSEGAVIPRSRDNVNTLTSNVDAFEVRQSLGLGARWLVQGRATASRDVQTLAPAVALAQEPHTGPAGAVPQVTIDLANAAAGGAFRFGSSASAARRRLPNEQRAEFQANAIFSGSAHALTFSAAGSLLDTRVDTADATSGAYQFSSRSVGGRAGGLVDFITDYTYNAAAYPNGGCPSIYATTHLFCFNNFTQSFGAGTSVRFHTAEGALGVRDVWRLTPRLHVTFGAQYEYFRMPTPQHTNLALDRIFGNLGQTNLLPGDPGNLAPRLSIAYGLHDRTVIRMGYGVHFGRVPGRTLQQVLTGTAQAASTYSLRITPQTSVEPACSSYGTNFGYPATYTCTPSGVVARTTAATILSRRFQLPMVQDAELTLEHRFGLGFTVSGSYALALSRELPNSVDANIGPSLGTAAFVIQRTDGVTTPGLRNGDTIRVPLYTARISPNYGPVTVVLSNGNAAYQAGVLQVTRVAARGFTLRGSYTFSKSLDNLRTAGSAVNTDAQFDPHDASFDRALSNFDRRHKVVFTAVWAPYADGGSRAIRLLRNGWSVAPILFATSGRPFSYNIEGGTALPGGRESINGSGGANYLPSVGRNTLRLPWLTTLDLKLTRAFTLHERTSLRLTAEGFNLFNHRNVTGVVQRAFTVGTTANGVTPLVFQDAAAINAEGLTSRPFATEVSNGTNLTRARRLQAGLRFEW